MPEENTSLQEYKGQSVTISNSVIRSRDYTNLLESKIEVLAIYYMDSNMKEREKKDSKGNPYKVNFVQLPAGEIKRLMGRADGKSYTDIKRAARHLKEKIFIMEDRETKTFAMRSMYGDIRYHRGILDIEIEPGMENYFLNLKDNFTKLSLPVLFSFKHNGGFQLYKLLRSYTYAPKLPQIDMTLSQEELPVARVTWGVTDLRMMMGYVDITQDALREEGEKPHPDWEKMANNEKKPQYRRWADFKKRVIDPGVEEINQISDIYIKDVEKEASGQGGKILSVTFVVQHNRAYYGNTGITKTPEVKAPMNEEAMDDFVDGMREFMGDSNLKIRELKSIAEAAVYDMDLIKKQYENSKHSNIDNLAAWMIAAVREDYNIPVTSSKDESKKKRNGFKNERNYDFEAIERKLVNRSRGM